MFARSSLGAWDVAQTCAPSASGEWLHDLWAAVNPRCLQYSPAAWSQMAKFETPPAPPAVSAPADLKTPPANQAQAEQTITDILSAQMKTWQAQNQKFFESQPYVAGDDNRTLLYAALAIGAVSLFALWRK